MPLGELWELGFKQRWPELVEEKRVEGVGGGKTVKLRRVI